MYPTTTVLIDALEGQAAWRATKQEEYPHDFRNGASAEALSKLAKTIKQMPEDDPHLRKLHTLDPEGMWIGFNGGTIGAPCCDTPAWLISRYGFGGEPQDPAAFLDDLARAVEESQDDYQRELDEEDKDVDEDKDEDEDVELPEDWAEQALDELIGRTSTESGKTVEEITELIILDLLGNPESRAFIEKTLIDQA